PLCGPVSHQRGGDCGRSKGPPGPGAGPAEAAAKGAGDLSRPAAQGEVTLPKRTRKAPAEAGAFFRAFFRGSLGANNSLTILCYSIDTMGLFWPQGVNMTRLCCHARRRYTQCFKF